MEMAAHSIPWAKGQDIYGTTLQIEPYTKGNIREHIHICNPPPLPSNSRWTNRIEFGKKKTVMSSSMGLGK
jgi:hypothetical protein